MSNRDRQKQMANKPADARYLQIVNVLKARIVSGLYPVGTLLPTEADFCAEFAVSRYTVREALRRLIALGLISRKQGAGTFVERSEAKESYFFALRSLTELFQYALDTSFKIVAIEELVLTSALAAEVGGKRGERWTVVTGLHLLTPEAQPFCFTKSYIPGRLSWLAPELPGCVGPFYAHIEKRANEPILTAQQHISASRASPEVASALGISESDVALLMMRRYVSATGTVVASFNWHNAAEFTYRMAIQRDGST